MLFVIAERQGTKFQVSYRFVVKNLPKRTSLDQLGWYRSGFNTRKDEPTYSFRPSFLCLNLRKLKLWGNKNIKFKKKASKLILRDGFLNKL